LTGSVAIIELSRMVTESVSNAEISNIQDEVGSEVLGCFDGITVGACVM
jgi:hypothetical protein